MVRSTFFRNSKKKENRKQKVLSRRKFSSKAFEHPLTFLKILKLLSLAIISKFLDSSKVINYISIFN